MMLIYCWNNLWAKPAYICETHCWFVYYGYKSTSLLAMSHFHAILGENCSEKFQHIWLCYFLKDVQTSFVYKHNELFNILISCVTNQIKVIMAFNYWKKSIYQAFTYIKSLFSVDLRVLKQLYGQFCNIKKKLGIAKVIKGHLPPIKEPNSATSAQSLCVSECTVWGRGSTQILSH